MMPKNPDCACPRDCPRHGDCEACIAFHKTRPNPPDCMRVKRRPAPRGTGRCLLVAGGPSGDRAGVELKAAPGDLVIACDAGYPAALRLGLKPPSRSGTSTPTAGRSPRTSKWCAPPCARTTPTR